MQSRSQVKEVFENILGQGEPGRVGRASGLRVHSLKSIREDGYGRVLYLEGMVYSAQGFGVYSQTIWDKGYGRFRWDCTCPDARRGKPCKHILALSRHGLEKIQEADEEDAREVQQDIYRKALQEAARDADRAARDADRAVDTPLEDLDSLF